MFYSNCRTSARAEPLIAGLGSLAYLELVK